MPREFKIYFWNIGFYYFAYILTGIVMPTVTAFFRAKL